MADRDYAATYAARKAAAGGDYAGQRAGQERRARMSVGRHLIEGHGFTKSEFGMFGDNPSARMLEGAHEQEHFYNQNALDHAHELFHDRRDEGRRHGPAENG